MNWKKLTIAGLITMAVVVAVGYVFYQVPWFWKYWTMIVVAIIALVVLAVKHDGTRNRLGMIAAHLRYNNNWRWVALFFLALILTISAIIAGFGKPVLTSSAKEVKASLTEKLDNYPQAKSELKSLLWGTNNTPSIFTPARVIEKGYSSWWHWKLAILLWLSWVVYTPFAFRDEARRAIIQAVKLVERRKRINQIREGSVATAIVTPTQTAQPQPTGVITKANLFKQLLQVEVLTEVLEIFFKLLFKRVGNLFTK